MRAPLLAALTLSLACASHASAQPGEVGELLFVDGAEVLVRSGMQGLSVAGSSGAPRRVWRNPIATMSSAARAPAAGGGGLVVAAVGQRVHVAFVPIEEGRAGPPVEHTIERLSGNRGAPVGITVAAHGAQGFTVFWQEAPSAQPGGTWKTYQVELGPDARPLGAAREIPVPWPMADALWADGRFTLLLYYARGAAQQTTFCAVHLTSHGAPSEHPYFAAQAGTLDEAQLVAVGSRVVAVYRGGPSGTDLLEKDVSTGSWGTDPGPSRALGPIGGDVAYGVRAEGSGVHVARRPL